MNRKISFGQRLMTIVSLCLIYNLLLPSTAFAYVDPGSGSVIVTTILGLIAAVGYTFRKYFYKMRRLFSGRDKNSQANDKK